MWTPVDLRAQSNVKHGSGKSTHGSVEWDMVDFPAQLATCDYQTAWLEPRTALSWRHQGFYPTTSTKVSECLKGFKGYFLSHHDI